LTVIAVVVPRRQRACSLQGPHIEARPVFHKPVWLEQIVAVRLGAVGNRERHRVKAKAMKRRGVNSGVARLHNSMIVSILVLRHSLCRLFPLGRSRLLLRPFF